MSTSWIDPPVPLEDRVDGVARRARHVGDDDALRADEGVQQRRLADVRAAEDRDADRLVADLRRALAGEQVDDAVEQVAGAVPVQGGERERVAESELVELDRLEVLARVVDLVREHDHRLLRGPQGDRELLVARRDPVPGVDDEEDEVGLRDRRARLLRDLGAERVGREVVDAARVDQEEVLAVPVREQLLAVAGDARRLVHDRLPRLGQPVDQRRLADVREADDRDRADDLGLLDLRGLGRLAHAGGRRVLGPAELVHLAEPGVEAVDPGLHLGGGLAVALRVLRQPVEAQRLAPGDRDRMPVAGLPLVRAVDRGRDDRDVLLERDHRRAGLHLPRNAVQLPRPLDEEAERVSLANRLAHLPHRLAVRLAAADRDRPEAAGSAGRGRGSDAPRPWRRTTSAAARAGRRRAGRSSGSG